MDVIFHFYETAKVFHLDFHFAFSFLNTSSEMTLDSAR